MVKIRREEMDTGMRLYEGQYPAVTDVLRPVENRAIKDWRASKGKEADKIMETARAFGTKVHTIAEKLAKTHGTEETVEVEYEMLPYARAIRDFLNEWVEEVLAVELRLVSHEFGFGGTTDLIARVTDKHGGGVGLFDLKTSKQLQREHGLQTAAYAIAARESGYEVDRRFAVRIKKEDGAQGKYHVREFEDHDADETAFLAVLTFFYWLNATRFAKLRSAS